MTDLTPVQARKVERVQEQTRAVVRQANDTSPSNTEPVAVSQIVAQVAGLIVNLAIFKGYVDMSQGPIVVDNAIVIAGAVQTLAAIIGAAYGRMKAYSPKTAAEIAVQNASSGAAAVRTGEPIVPTLLSPP